MRIVKNAPVGIILSAALLASAFSVSMASAAELRAGENPGIGTDEHITEDAYVAGGSVTSTGTVDGDLILAGGNVLVSGPVTQDVIAAGGNVSLLGSVGDDVRVAGGTIVVNGEVKGDIIAGGGQTTISGKVGGDVVWGGGMLRIDAPVAGDLKLGGGDVVINAPVKGNVHFEGGTLALGSGAVIEGNLYYKTEKEATMTQGAVVKGTTVFDPRTPRPETSNMTFASLLVLNLLMSAAAALVVGLMFHGRIQTLTNLTLSQPMPALGRGFVALIVIPATAIILMVTIIGIPLGALVGLAYAMLVILSGIFSSIMVGSLLYRWLKKSEEYKVTWGTIILGVLVMVLFKYVPVVGWMLSLIFFVMSLGALSKAAWEGVRKVN